MRFRLSAWLPALIVACCSNWALALGLGEIKLNSALNQPLNAEIELLQVRDLEAAEISVTLANADEFQRLGIDRPFFLNDLNFSVDLQAASGPVVRVTSLKPVREPFLNFVVNARWPSGRLLREYTLLVDLPVFSGGRAQAPATPARAAPPAEPATPSAPPPTRVTPPPAAQQQAAPAEPSPAPAAAAAAEEASDTYGPVGVNDSLWAIASRVRPSREFSVQQTMLAIQRLNPDAFINNNINLLRRGQVLRVPAADEIEALTFQQAVRQVAEQNSAFENRGAAAPAAAEPERAQLDASETPTAAPEAAPEPEGRVKLSAPSDAAAGGSATGDGRDLNALETELNQAQEQLDAANKDSGELRSRIDTMEEQIDTMERLVEVSSEEMRALEVAARQLNQPEGAEVPAADDATDTDVTGTENTVIDNTVTDTTATDAPAATDAEATEAAVVADAPAAEQPQPVTERRPAKSGGLIDTLLDNILWIGLVLLLIVGAVLAFIFLRKRDNWDDEEFDALDREFPQDLNGDDVTQVAAPVDPTERTGFADAASDEATVDQADALIAAGDYGAAGELLESELKAQPDSDTLRIKALEVYAALGQHQRFDAHYAEVLRRGDAALTQRAELLRHGMIDAPAFSPSRYGLAAGVVAATQEFQLSDDTLQFDLPPDDVLDGEDLLDGESELVVESSPELGLAAEPELIEEPQYGGPYEETDFETPSEPEPELIVVAPPATAPDDDFDLNFDDIDLELEGASVPMDSLADLDAELGGFDFDDLGEPEPRPTGELIIEEISTEGLDLDFSDLEETAAVPAPVPVHDALFDDNNEFDAALELDLSPEVNTANDTGSLAENFLGEEDLLLELDESETAGTYSLDGYEADLTHEPATDTAPKSGAGTRASSYDFLEPDLTGLEEEESESDVLKLDDESSDGSGVDHRAAESRVVSAPFSLPDVDPEADDDSQLGFLSDGDETATKLDLARAYLDMGDADGAKDILDEIMEEGDQEQRREAETLLAKLG